MPVCEKRKKERRKGRAKGRIITGIRKEIAMKDKEERQEKGLMESFVKTVKREWKIIGM